MIVFDQGDGVYENKMVVKLFGVLVIDEFSFEICCELGLDLVSGEVGEKVVLVLRDIGCFIVFVNSKLVLDDEKMGRIKVIILVDGIRRICSEVIVSVKMLYILGKVYVLCFDLFFVDVIIGNNVSIVVLKEVVFLIMIEIVEIVDEKECGVV